MPRRTKQQMDTALQVEGYPAHGTQPYGRSGSILLLNPTDRRVNKASDLPPEDLRDPAIIRTWPEELAPLPPPPAPSISGVTGDGVTITVSGVDFTPAAVIYAKVGTGAGTFDAVTTTYVSATELTGNYPTSAGQNYVFKVLDQGGESGESIYSPIEGREGDDPC